MKKLKKSKPYAHPSRKIFKINDIPITEVARALNLNYSYVCAMLAGSRPVPIHVDLKLHELMSIVLEQFAGQASADPKMISADYETGDQPG